jgi:hypothetical protein
MKWFDGSNPSLDDRLVELSLGASLPSDGMGLSFHVYVLILTFYFVINTKPHFAQQTNFFPCRGLGISYEALLGRKIQWPTLKQRYHPSWKPIIQYFQRCRNRVLGMCSVDTLDIYNLHTPEMHF